MRDQYCNSYVTARYGPLETRSTKDQGLSEYLSLCIQLGEGRAGTPTQSSRISRKPPPATEVFLEAFPKGLT
jgi:hypothetical protein